jgi:hypothetical protein
MGILNFPGRLSAAVVLQWKGDSVANPITTSMKDGRYVTANESLTAFTIKLSPGGRQVLLSRQASKQQRFFDDALKTYTINPVAGADLDELLAAGVGTKGTISCTFTYARFFATLLQQMTRVDATPYNLAYPENPAAVLDTFTHSNAGGRVSIKYKRATQTITALPCTLADFEVQPGQDGRPPALKLVFELDFLTDLDDVRKEGMLKLVAMDWSKLAHRGEPAAISQTDVATWWANVIGYLVNHTDIARGERFRRELVTRHTGKTAQVLAKELRDDIDRLMITANHWGEAREDMGTEHYQRLLSDLFGTLHQNTALSSPVTFLRAFRDELKLELSLVECAALALQYGAGHCGEHAQISFTVLRDIIRAPAAKIVRAVLTGNANIDHQFVVFDLDVDTVIDTLAAASNNTVVEKGKEIEVWNLREAIAKNGPRVGFVMDPYLDPSVMKPTARELLEALNNKKRQASKKATDFLRFLEEFPSSYAEIDITNRSEAERLALVPNV